MMQKHVKIFQSAAHKKRAGVFLLALGGIIFFALSLSKVFSARAAEMSINRRSDDIFFQGKPSLTHFTSRDGLPVNSVMTIKRDRRGYIWFGTQDGAAVFNGNNFKVVNMPSRATSNYIYDILTASDGSVWFGTNGGGVHHLKDNQWTSYSTENGLASSDIRALLETKTAAGRQVIWVGRRDGLSKFEDGAWTNFESAGGLPDPRVRCLLETTGKNGEKALWIGTYGGIAVWRGDEKKFFDDSSGLPGKTVFALLETRNEQDESLVWAATDRGLAKFENEKWETFEDLSENLTKPARALGKTSKADGTTTLWVGFDGGGIAYLENDRWYFLDQSDGLSSNTVMAFSETGALDGSVWISNLGVGVSRFERSNWRRFEKSHTLPNELVFDIEETVGPDGTSTFWFATYGGGLARFQNGEWKVFTSSDGLGNDFVQSLLATKNASGETVLYAGTEKGLLIYENGAWREIPLTEEFPILEIWNIRETTDENGRPELLIAASYGVIRKSDDRQTIIDHKNGLPNRRVRDALETVDKNGQKTLWAATYSGGLAKFSDGVWTVFNEKNGFPTNKVYTLAEVRIGAARQLWVGTGGGGIAVFDLETAADNFEIISGENSQLLPSDTVYKIFQDERGRIYATTTKGIARLTPQPGGVPSFDSYIFTIEDGLPENECISGSGYVDRRGRIWVGTVGGAGLLDISREIDDTRAEPLFLENVLVNGEKRDLLPGAALPYNENNLVFEYVMPTNFRESSTLYRTQLFGLEEKPTEWTREPHREFTYLPSGEYVFKIWGKDAGGNISGPLEIPFQVLPAWWQTWWAFLLFTLATAGVVALIAYAVYRNRYLRMLEIERVRTRIATDLHDDVGASLSKISILSEFLVHNGNGNLGAEEKDSLLSIADTSRSVVGSMSDMVWSINPNRDNLRDTVQRMRRFAIELLTARDIHFTFDAPEDEHEVKLDVDMRRQLYLVFKEGLNNAVKHSGCTSIAIKLKQEKNEIVLTIRDNGRGFDPGEMHHGNGLVNMRARCAEIGGSLEIKSEKGKGTTLNLRVPRRHHGFSIVKST
jgi:ligand-binding sensor domain-containing protein/two-component sensor histidine kinase